MPAIEEELSLARGEPTPALKPRLLLVDDNQPPYSRSGWSWNKTASR